MISEKCKTKSWLCLIVPAMLGLAACVPPPEWTKAGGTQDELSRVRYQCLQESQQRAAASKSVGNAYGAYQSASVDKTITNDTLFRACMNSHGWYLTNQSASSAQAQPSAPQPTPSAGAQAPAPSSAMKPADPPKKATSKAQPKVSNTTQQKASE